MQNAHELDFEEEDADIDPSDSYGIELPSSGFELRDYQVKCVAATEQGWEQYNRQLIVIPTAGGKTLIFSKITSNEVKKGGRVLILAHTEELLQQAADKLYDSTGLESDREKADDHASLSASVVIASVQTLSKETRLMGFPDYHFSLVIVDECHHVLSASYTKIVNYFHFGDASLDEEWVAPVPGVPYKHKARILGVTATPDRGDKKNLGQFFQFVAFEFGLIEAVREGYLVRPVVKNIPLQIDLRGIKISRSKEGADYDKAQVSARLTPLLKAIAAAIANEAASRKTVIFLPSVDSARRLAEACCEAGLDADFVSGACIDRADKVARFEAAGPGSVLMNAQMLTEGWDCLDAQTEILTDRGWKGYCDMDIHDLGNAFTLNVETGDMEMVPIDVLGTRPVRSGERMAIFKSQHIDIRTTEGHIFFVSKGRSKKINLRINGALLAERQSPYALPLAAEASFPAIQLSDDEIKFIAWFMTDGGFMRSNLCISQSKKYVDEIRRLIIRLGFDFKERVRDRVTNYGPNILHEFRIPKGNHTGSLKRTGWGQLEKWLDKNVSPLLHEMNRRQFTVFWSELLKGDGEQLHKSGWLWCNLKNQVDAYTQMAVTRGFSSSYSERLSKKTGQISYRVSVRDKQWIEICPKDKRSTKATIGNPDANERVWCVKNRNGTLVSRRNGKIAIIGNCPDVDCVCVLRPTKIRSLFVQAAGRGMRTLKGLIDKLKTKEERLAAIARSSKRDCLILDFLWLADRLDLVRPVDLVTTRAEVRDRMATAAAAGATDLLAMELGATRDLMKSLETAARQHANKKARVVDPLVWAVSMGDEALANWEPQTAWDSLPCTEPQLTFIRNQHIDTTNVKCRGHANKIIARLLGRMKLHLATVEQLNFMRKLGIPEDVASTLTLKEASATIDATLNEKKARREAAN